MKFSRVLFPICLLWLVVYIVPAQAAIQITYQYSNAYVSGYYVDSRESSSSISTMNSNDYGYAVNDISSAYDSYDGTPDTPFQQGGASAGTYTDSSTYLNVYGSAYTKNDPTSNFALRSATYAKGFSYTRFTVDSDFTATLYLYARAYSEYPGDFGTSSARASAYLKDYATGEYVGYKSLSSQDGEGTISDSGSYDITLTAGEYELSYATAYSQGYAYNDNYYVNVDDSGSYQSSYARAYLYNFEEVIAPPPVPEPFTLLIWSLLAVCGIVWHRRDEKRN